MECPICYDDLGENTYIIGCDAKHVICESCEIKMRLLTKISTPTIFAETCRPITCPLCRGLEKVTGKRSERSIQSEFHQIYEGYSHMLNTHRRDVRAAEDQHLQLAFAQAQIASTRTQLIAAREATRRLEAIAANTPHPQQVANITSTKQWCEFHATISCTTQSKTTRHCSGFTLGNKCGAFVCRSCSMCSTHKVEALQRMDEILSSGIFR